MRAYAAVLAALRSGMQVPDLYGPLTMIPELVHLLESIKQRPDVMEVIGPMVTFAAVCVAWAASARLGIALTAFVLFLTGYPAIEFESRHWFHLRFIPWWSLLLMTVMFRHRPALQDRRHWRRGAIPAAVTVVLMVLMLAVVRIYQHRSVALLAEGYSAAPLEQLGTRPRVGGGIDVDWRPEDAGGYLNHRASDMLVVTIDSRGCAAPGPIDLRIGYDADASPHDMSTTVRVRRGGKAASRNQGVFPGLHAGVSGAHRLAPRIPRCRAATPTACRRCRASPIARPFHCGYRCSCCPTGGMVLSSADRDTMAASQVLMKTIIHVVR